MPHLILLWLHGCSQWYPLFMGFPRQYWSGLLPFPSPRDLPGSGIELASPSLAGRFVTTKPPGKPKHTAAADQRGYGTWKHWNQCCGLPSIQEAGKKNLFLIFNWKQAELTTQCQAVILTPYLSSPPTNKHFTVKRLALKKKMITIALTMGMLHFPSFEFLKIVKISKVFVLLSLTKGSVQKKEVPVCKLWRTHLM